MDYIPPDLVWEAQDFHQLDESYKFQGILEAARAQIRETGGIGHEEFWQEIEREIS